MKNIALAACLLHLTLGAATQPQPPASFATPVSGVVAGLRPDSKIQIFVEADASEGWQQYQSMALADDRGWFEVKLLQPGIYWLLAIDSAPSGARRGACLVEFSKETGAKWRPLPPLRVSNKWGGRASGMCRDGKIPLFTKAERLANRYRAKK